jgi:hypothetical protein
MLTQSSYFVPYTEAVKSRDAKISSDHGFAVPIALSGSHISGSQWFVVRALYG